MPVSCDIPPAATAATRSASPTTTKGTIHSQGLRYVMISKIATTRTVASSRLVLAPSKTLAMSAEKPAGPVTCACRPRGRSARTIVRISATLSAVASTSLLAASGTVTNATVPSFEITGGGT